MSQDGRRRLLPEVTVAACAGRAFAAACSTGPARPTYTFMTAFFFSPRGRERSGSRLITVFALSSLCMAHGGGGRDATEELLSARPAARARVRAPR